VIDAVLLENYLERDKKNPEEQYENRQDRE